MKSALATVALLATLAAQAGPLPAWVSGKAAAPEPKVAHETSLRLPDSAPPAGRVRLTTLDASLRERLNAGAPVDEKRIAVGAARSLAAESSLVEGTPNTARWIPAAGGFATRIEITSPGAASLRLGMHAKALPAGAQIRVRGTTQRVVGPIAGEVAVAATLEQGVYWTPVTEGETQSIEIWIPQGANASRVRFSVESLSHLTAKASSLFKTVGTCQEDVICYEGNNAALANAARSVAKLVYTENGVTYLCSGTLISDGSESSQVPYLYTAAHCIDTQAAAATLNTFWFFDAASCGGKSSSDYRQLSGGATLLYANADTDAALVRLTDRAPEGAWFAGWDSTPLASGTAIIGLHHPGGDLKKIAMGQALDPTAGTGGNSYATAAWVAGTTEKGSSGSGIFTLSGGQYLLRGGLKGGSASCDSSGKVTDPSNRDYYSRLDVEAPQLRTWLSASPAPLEDYTDMWWNPDEPGWGISVQQHADNHVFVTHYAYDANGKPTWLVMPEARWTTAVTIEGAVYRASGPPSDGAYDPKRFAVTPVGSARIEFGHDGQATLSLTADGRTVAKGIRRQAF